MLRIEPFKEQVVKVETEVGCRRHGAYPGVLDPPMRIQGEGDEGVSPQLAVVPSCDEGVVMPVFERADQ